MNVDEIVDYWLRTAAADLIAAEHLLESGDYAHALFFAHLYLEKLLKAQVVQHTKTHAPRSHNLRYLAERGGLALDTDRELLFVRVTDYSIATRYPDMSEPASTYSRTFCETELAAIKEVGEWIKQETTS